MLKDIAKKYYLEEGYNCAEAVVFAANDYYGLMLTPKQITLVSAYGGGIQAQKTCGALLGAVAVASYTKVETKAHESTIIRPLVNELVARFEEMMKSTDCIIIRPMVMQPGLRCFKSVEVACDLLEEILKR